MQSNRYGNRKTSIRGMKKEEKINRMSNILICFSPGCILLWTPEADSSGHETGVALMQDGDTHILSDCHSGIINFLGRSDNCPCRSFNP